MGYFGHKGRKLRKNRGEKSTLEFVKSGGIEFNPRICLIIS